MGASCSLGAAVATAAECRQGCENTQIVQILDCAKDDLVDQEVLANCTLIRAARDGTVADLLDALAKGAELETRTSKYVMLPMKSWGEEGDAPDALLPTSSGWQEPPISMRFGLTPLMLSCKEGHSKVVKLLLDYRACPNTEDEDGMRPLHFAAEAGSLDICTLLVSAGASPLAKDESGRDAFNCLPSECLRASRQRQSWEALLRPTYGADAGADAGAGGSAQEDQSKCQQPKSKLGPKLHEDWDPFLGLPMSQDGM